MSGTIQLALSQQFDVYGDPLAGGLLYTYQAATVATPQSAYQDPALEVAHPNPITLDAAGRVPQIYFADGQIKIVLTDRDGVVQISADNVMVVGPSSGGGGPGGGVDPTTVFQTGMPTWTLDPGPYLGWVPCNARTIGSISSGATERPNQDTQNLYVFCWNKFSNAVCPVFPSRGASALADFNDGKPIGLPDMRSRGIIGVSGMGNAASAIMNGVAFLSGNAATAASIGGAARKTLSVSELPSVTPSGTITINETPHDHGVGAGSIPNGGFGPNDYAALVPPVGSGGGRTGPATTGITATFNGTPFGDGATFDLLPPFITVYFWLKL